MGQDLFTDRNDKTTLHAMVAYKHEQVFLYKVTFPVNPSNFAFSIVYLRRGRGGFFSYEIADI